MVLCIVTPHGMPHRSLNHKDLLANTEFLFATRSARCRAPSMQAQLATADCLDVGMVGKLKRRAVVRVKCSPIDPSVQVNSHQADGMMALYNITGQQPAFPLNGTVRTYYIQAVRSANAVAALGIPLSLR